MVYMGHLKIYVLQNRHTHIIGHVHNFYVVLYSLSHINNTECTRIIIKITKLGVVESPTDQTKHETLEQEMDGVVARPGVVVAREEDVCLDSMIIRDSVDSCKMIE